MSKSDRRQIWSSSQVYEWLVLEWKVKSMPIQVLSTVIFPLHTPQWIEVIVAGAKYKPWLWMGAKKESAGSSLVLTLESCFSHVFLSKIIFVFLRFDILTTMLAIKKFVCVQQKRSKILHTGSSLSKVKTEKMYSFCMVETCCCGSSFILLLVPFQEAGISEHIWIC